MNYTNKFLINGPVNVIRLEGKIGDTKKMVYIFGDNHIDITNQTKCEDISIDIDQLFPLIFKENKKMKYDFFVEMDKEVRDNKTNYKKYDMRYISNVVEFFVENFREVLNSKVNTSEKYKNTRFHYFDIRTEHFKNLMNVHYNLSEFLGNLNTYDTIFKQDLSELSDALNIYLKLLKDLTLNLQKSDIKDMVKLRKKYNHKIVNDHMKEILKIHIKLLEESQKELEILIGLVNKFIKDFEKNKLLDPFKLLEEYKILFNNIYSIDDKISVLLAYTTDLFFLRRFLDKNYIKNGIIYCGIAHCQHMAYVLVKYFNFKITHIHYKDNKLTLKKLMDKLKKLKYDDNKVNKLAILMGRGNINSELLYQCVDMSKFPKNLT